MKLKIFAAIIFLVFCTSADAALTLDLKTGIIGSGGYGIGGAVYSPFFYNTNVGIDAKYTSLSGFTGTFYPVQLNISKNVNFMGQPGYVGAGANYLTSSGKQNNVDVQGGIGGQIFLGVESRLSDTISLIVELGALSVQAKLTGGNFTSSSMGFFNIGLRNNPYIIKEAPAPQPKIEVEKVSIPEPAPEPPQKSAAEYKLFTVPESVEIGKPIVVVIIPEKDTKIITASMIFENNKKVGFAKKVDPNLGETWKAYYELPKTFKPGVHKIKIYLSFMSGETHLKSVVYKIIK